MTKSIRIAVADHEKERWDQAAEKMGVSKSQYYRRMIRSGRRQWGYEQQDSADQGRLQLEEQETRSNTLNSDLESTVRRNLSTTDGLSEEEVAKLVYDDLQDQIEEVLAELKKAGEADYDPTRGGWVKQ